MTNTTNVTSGVIYPTLRLGMTQWSGSATTTDGCPPETPESLTACVLGMTARPGDAVAY